MAKKLITASNGMGLTAVQRLLKKRQRIKAVNKIGGISGGILELGF